MEVGCRGDGQRIPVVKLESPKPTTNVQLVFKNLEIRNFTLLPRVKNGNLTAFIHRKSVQVSLGEANRNN